LCGKDDAAFASKVALILKPPVHKPVSAKEPQSTD